jgi:hypothetical protein
MVSNWGDPTTRGGLVAQSQCQSAGPDWGFFGLRNKPKTYLEFVVNPFSAQVSEVLGLF